MRKDIETPESVLGRVSAGFRGFSGGDNCNNLVFGHIGMMNIIINQLGMSGLFLQNCACLMIETNSDGTPIKIHNFWNDKQSLTVYF